MADWAGAYGAGGASDALRQFLTDKLTREKFDEEKRQAGAREASDAASRNQRDTLAKMEADAAASRDEVSRQERYSDRQERSRQFGATLEERKTEQQIRAQERADDREAGLEGEDRQRKFQTSERMARQSFEERLMRARQSGSGDSEPLVSITDPATGQPKLVPRREAVGQRPASTREQALTEGQSNSAGFADRMKFNEPAIQGYEGSVGRVSQLQGMMPGEFQSAGFQKYEAAKKNWIAAQLRKESGAAISQGEYDEADRQYFPQPGDNPQVVQQKRELRALAASSMRRASGSASGETGVGGMGVGTPAGGTDTQPPRQTRTIRNRVTGETKQQVSLDGGATWN